MAFPSTFRRAVALASLLLALASAQTCYYPDGTISNVDTPCNTDPVSSCCGSSAFCLGNGLCYTAGLVTRGSCTDKTWGSEACAGYCKTVSPNTDVAIVPCTTTSGTIVYDCGLTTETCQNPSNLFNISSVKAGELVLRPAQVAQLVSSAVTTADNSTNAKGMFGIGALAGVAAALGVPLLISIAICIILYRRDAERRPRAMYPLPDGNKSEFSFRPPGVHSPGFPPYRPSSSHRDDVSMRSGTTGGLRSPPVHLQSFAQRHAKNVSASKQNLRINVASSELDSKHIPRHELGDGVSIKSARGQVREVIVSR